MRSAMRSLRRRLFSGNELLDEIYVLHEMPGAEERVAHDQDRPPLADHLERAGDRADLVFVGSVKHLTEA